MTTSVRCGSVRAASTASAYAVRSVIVVLRDRAVSLKEHGEGDRGGDAARGPWRTDLAPPRDRAAGEERAERNQRIEVVVDALDGHDHVGVEQARRRAQP